MTLQIFLSRLQKVTKRLQNTGTGPELIRQFGGAA